MIGNVAVDLSSSLNSKSQFEFVYLRAKVARRVILLSIALLLILLRARWPLVNPRFWAEEGSVYYVHCSASTFLGCIAFIHIGGLQLLLNGSSYLSTIVPIVYAPVITTYISFIVIVIVVGQAIAFCERYELDYSSSILLVAAICLLPATYETWLTATNIQWLCGVSMLIILVTLGPEPKRNTWIQAGWAAACCLSGIPSVLTAPLFALRFAIDRSRAAAIIFLVATACALLQLALLHYFGAPASRPLAIRPVTFLLAGALQTIVAPLFTVDLASKLASAINAPASAIVSSVGCVVLAAAVAIPISRAAFGGAHSRPALLILAAWVFVTTIQVFGALDQVGLISGFGGSRYFLFGSVCLCLICSLGTASPNRRLRRISYGAVTAICISGIATTMFSRWPSYFSGPPWTPQIEACPLEAPCQVSIWPAGWTMEITRRR
jgi:hypothetical protein